MENNKRKLDYYLEYFENERKSIEPWVRRKELAVWSAVVLYLSGLFAITNFISKVFEYRTITLDYFFPISLTILMLLFMRFIYIQFKYIGSALNSQQAINFWIITIINKNRVPKELSFEIDKKSVNPISRIAVAKYFNGDKFSDDEDREYLQYIPKEKPEVKPVIRKKFFDKMSLHEKEKAMIYNLIILPTIGICFYYFFLFDC